MFGLFTLPLLLLGITIICFGRDGDASNPFRNIGRMSFAVDYKSAQAASQANGLWTVEVSKNNATPSHIAIATGDTRTVITGGVSGFSSLIQAADGGYAGIAYEGNIALYMHSTTEVTWAAHFIPETDDTYDIGSPTGNKARDIYCTSLHPTDGISATITVGGTDYNFVDGILTSTS
jgi:hypothetical protein